MGETPDESITMDGDFRISFPDPGMLGLDELAAELGVGEPKGSGIILEGRSGRRYDLVALLAAHLREMRRSRG